MTDTLALRLTPTDLTLLQDVVRDKIEHLDQTLSVLTDRELADTLRLMRGVWARMDHQITQLLDVPFLDNEAAMQELWTDRESQPEFTGVFR